VDDPLHHEAVVLGRAAFARLLGRQVRGEGRPLIVGEFSFAAHPGRPPCLCKHALAGLTIVLTVVLLWAGVKKVQLSSLASAVVSILDLALFAVAVVQLGRAGAFLFGGVNLLAALAYSIRPAIQYDDILTDAAVQNGSDRNEMKALATRLLSSGKAFQVLRPRGTARLLKYLSQRSRSICGSSTAPIWKCSSRSSTGCYACQGRRQAMLDVLRTA